MEKSYVQQLIVESEVIKTEQDVADISCQTYFFTDRSSWFLVYILDWNISNFEQNFSTFVKIFSSTIESTVSTL